MENTLFCADPKIIINPQIWDAIYRNGSYVCDCYCIDVPKSIAYTWLLNHPFIFPPAKNVTKDSADRFYSVDDDGVITPAYMFVPCGHCDLCQATKSSEWSQRCLMEAQLYDMEPMFVTLTYNDDHLPECGLLKRDLQLFFKRLRHYVPAFRYFACGEYGKRGRAHYHIIFFINRVDYRNFDYFCNSIKKSWSSYDYELSSFLSFGFSYIKRLVLDGVQAFSYVAKYLSKGCQVPPGANPNFLTSSRSAGGIGYPFFKSFIDVFRLNPKYNENRFQYLDRWSGKIQKFNLNRYFFRKVFPTLSQLIDYRFRVAFKNLSIWSRCEECGVQFCQDLQEFLSGFNVPGTLFFPKLRSDQIARYRKSHKNFLWYKSIRDIQRMIFRIPMKEYVDDLLYRRDVFLSSLPRKLETDLTPIIASFRLRKQQSFDKLMLA